MKWAPRCTLCGHRLNAKGWSIGNSVTETQFGDHLLDYHQDLLGSDYERAVRVARRAGMLHFQMLDTLVGGKP